MFCEEGHVPLDDGYKVDGTPLDGILKESSGLGAPYTSLFVYPFKGFLAGRSTTLRRR